MDLLEGRGHVAYGADISEPVWKLNSNDDHLELDEAKKLIAGMRDYLSPDRCYAALDAANKLSA